MMHRIDGVAARDGIPVSGQDASKLRVLLVDDDAVFRRGLRHLLNVEGIDIAGDIWTGDAAVIRSAELVPDVVLLGLSDDGPRGLETLRLMREFAPDVPVVVMAVSSDPADLLAAISAETRGLVTKDSDVEEIIAGLRSAAAGGIFLSPAVLPGLLSRLREMIDSVPKWAASASLSERENEVLKLMAHGMENAEIAVRLSISVRTVKAHVSSIFEKLGVENRVQAAVMASRTSVSTSSSMVSAI